MSSPERPCLDIIPQTVYSERQRPRRDDWLMIGRTLAHYRIVEEISRGGMGVVYRATDTRLNRDVALKVLPDELVHDAERRERLLHEARAASALEHPNIAVIHAVDDVDGVTFIAMELIRGEKLSATLERGPLSQARALDLAIEIAEGLARAHETGVVHRDLKPANVMITDDGHAKIIDFGLAKLTEPAASDVSTATLRARTEEGVILGTAAYMSPEQARGVRVDHRSDVFSFGVLLYEMLAGRPAFHGESRLDTLNAILTQPVPPLPAASGSAEIARDVQRVIAKSTAKEPGDRYQGMKDLVVDLRAARRRLESTSGSGLTAPAAPAAVRDWRAPGRAALLAASAVGAIVLVAGWWWWGRDRPDTVTPSGKPAVAVLYFDNNTGDASLDWMRTGLADMLVTDLSQSTDFEVLGTDRVQQILQELRRDDDPVMTADVVRAIAERAAVDTVLLGSYVRSGDVIRINARLQNASTGRVVTSERVEGPGASSLFSLVDELTRRFKTRLASLARPAALLAPPGGLATEAGLDRGVTEITTPSIEAYRWYAEGIHAHERGLPARAAPLLEKAIEIDPDFAMAHAKLAVVHNNLGAFVQRDEFATRAVALVDRLTARERYYIEGFFYSLRTDTYPRAIEAYSQGLSLHPEHQASRHNLALLFQFLERYPEAIEHYEELIRRGISNPTSHENLSELYSMSGNAPRAREVAESYLRRFPDSPAGLRNLGTVLIAQGQLDQALPMLQKAEALNPQDFAARLGQRAIAVFQGRWADAESLAQEMEEGPLFERFLGRVVRATIASARGRGREALAHLERAASVPGIAPFNRAVARTRQGLLLLRQGDAAAARAQLQLALPDSRDREQEYATLQFLAIAEGELGRAVEAAATLAELETLAGALPSSREVRRLHWVRGALARARGDAAAAAEELSRAASLLTAHGPALGPPSPHATLWYAAADALIAAGREAEAAALLERLQHGHERFYDMDAYGRSFYLLGHIHERRGEAARAREQYARFLDLWRDGDLERGWVADAQKRLTTLGR
jgi:tetratricopeptide (TPR) repeat protein/predicted Ser/Thr protein kinase